MLTIHPAECAVKKQNSKNKKQTRNYTNSAYAIKRKNVPVNVKTLCAR